MTRTLTGTMLALMLLTGACSGNDVGATTTADTPATSPSTTTTDPALGLAIGPWGDLDVMSVCIESTERFEQWILVDDDTSTLPDELDRRPGPAGMAEVLVPVFHGESGPVALGLADALEAEGIEILEAECAAVLTLDLAGEPLSAAYLGRRLFTGAAVVGSIGLSAADQPTLEATIDARREPPASIVSDSDDSRRGAATDAPFLEVATEGICDALTDWVSSPFDLRPELRCAHTPEQANPIFDDP